MELERCVLGAVAGALEDNAFVRNEIKVHSRIRVTASSIVEKPSSRENAEAEPIPPINAIGAT